MRLTQNPSACVVVKVQEEFRCPMSSGEDISPHSVAALLVLPNAEDCQAVARDTVSLHVIGKKRQ